MRMKKVLSLIEAMALAGTMAVGCFYGVGAEELEAESTVDDVVEIDFYNIGKLRCIIITASRTIRLEAF